ncbi:DUF6418 domain-containing protein [Ulvibacter antarcticus]|uniref:DUF6418 domain-containing protein n=1 Tax=Ulvibacter antarcticus TaxID=442714 RepID=A0A3L9YZ35_9FLAO|nr:DUF6418 domain-containing protein [Ulvibacter antarcticus]RMA65981.1 hypothetical protein BXY75_0397 [Ulvibacter antarcticus]
MEFLINILFAVLFGVFAYFYAKNSFTLSFLYGLIFYQAFSTIPSLIYLEQGIYINEQGRYSFFTGATILSVLYFIFTLIIIAMAFKSFNKKKLPTFNLVSKGRNIDLTLLVVIVIISMALLLLNAALSPLPMFSSSVDRFTYWSSSRLPFLNKIFGNTGIFIPFALGVLFPKYKKFSIFMLFLFYGYNFLIGQKFSPILAGTYSFLLPLVFYYRKNLTVYIKRALLPLFLIFVILVGVMYQITYTKYEETRPFANIQIYDPNEAMVYRIFGLQGHLLWGATERYVINDNPKSFNPTDLLYGMPVMMKEYAKDKKMVLNANAEGGYNFTNAYPGILFQIFPLSMALVFHTFLTICFLALMGWMLKEFMTQGAWFLSVIAYQLFNWVLYAFVMGYFYKLYFTIFFFVVYGFYVYFRKRKNDSHLPELQN